mmetsp:Transcript_82334/g.176315  ORF Transcript_82334/g.176315 Transcript_82334/m.176315 type:complete len:218 (-) Transcript_82334:565-1218(-)
MRSSSMWKRQQPGSLALSATSSRPVIRLPPRTSPSFDVALGMRRPSRRPSDSSSRRRWASTRLHPPRSGSGSAVRPRRRRPRSRRRAGSCTQRPRRMRPKRKRRSASHCRSFRPSARRGSAWKGVCGSRWRCSPPNGKWRPRPAHSPGKSSSAGMRPRTRWLRCAGRSPARRRNVWRCEGALLHPPETCGRRTRCYNIISAKPAQRPSRKSSRSAVV